MKLTTIDRTGIRGPDATPTAPVKLLGRVEELGLLSTIADAGLLSSAEESGVFSKLEASGAFSKIEGLLPLADDLNLLGIAETLLSVDSSLIVLGAVTVLLAEAGLIYYVPDDTTALLALQGVTGILAVVAAGVLLGTSYLFSLLQSD